MFAVEMWFGVGDGVECGRSTGLCPLPLGVPRCVIHNKKNVGTQTKGTVLLVCGRMGCFIYLASGNQKNRPFGLWFLSYRLVPCRVD